MSDASTATLRPVTARCARCAALFVISVQEQADLLDLARQHPEREWRLPSRCPSCRQRVRVVIDDGVTEHRTCSTCHKPFEFGGHEKTRFARAGLQAPRNCHRCRAARWERHGERH